MQELTQEPASQICPDAHALPHSPQLRWSVFRSAQEPEQSLYGAGHVKEQVPAEQTNAESFYYLKQMQNHTAMVVVLNDGTELSGWIEWYDKACIKFNRADAPNLLLFKHSIKYMFKEEELHQRRRRRATPAR